ncbi:MAG: iron ABC transporter permease [Ruminococcaceae bacterium]|nr:iron ABC transporter permease [Oscillospiraceae bacterium]
MNNRQNFKDTNRTAKVCIISASLLAAAVVAALLLGSAKLSPLQVVSALAGRQSEEINVIVQNIRLPRVFAAVVAGAGLSVAGILLQAVTDNDLASPNIIGINSGAGFAVIVVIALFPQVTYLLPFAAFLGAFGAAMLIVYTSSRIGVSKSTVVLAGVALTAILNACISFISVADTDTMSVYSHFSVGGLAGVTTGEIVLPSVLVAISFAVAMFLSQQISILCLGDSLAASLGVRVRLMRIICLVCASLCAASVVSFAGLLGFVGLVVPHIARALVGKDVKASLAVSALLGAVLVVSADMFGRIILAPSEVPVGIVMAFIGAPFFLYLLLRRKHYAENK